MKITSLFMNAYNNIRNSTCNTIRNTMCTKLHEYHIHKRIQVIIPFMFTFANALFGLLSIIKTFEGNFVFAAWCIVGAVVIDSLDGRVARYFGTQGALGLELDSLCDAISFCLAPTVLLYSWYLQDFGHTWLFMPAVGFFLCAGLFRLARFNICEQDQTSFFFGLPTTIAAFFLIQFVFYEKWMAQSICQFFLKEKVLVGIVAFVAFLMISSIRFPAFKNKKFSFIARPVTYIKLLLVICVTWWCAWHGYPLVLMLLTGYIIGGLLGNIFTRIKKRFY